MKTFIRKLFGTKTAPIRRAPRARLGLEALDGRLVPSAVGPGGPGSSAVGPGAVLPQGAMIDLLTPGVRLQGSTVYVIGDAEANDHTVSVDGGELRVTTKFWHTGPAPDINSPPLKFWTAKVDTYPAAGVTKVVYYGHGADDVFVNETAVPTKGYGGSGHDELAGGSGADALDGGSGADVLEGRGGDDSLTGGTGNDVLVGGSGNDSLTGGTGTDTYKFAGSTFGRDTIAGSAAAADVLDFSDMTRAVRVDLGSTDQQVVAGYTSYLTLTRADLIGAVLGGPHADDLRGDGRPNGLHGNGGDDTLAGGGGNDYLTGGWGNDSLAGDAGRDRVEGGGGHDTLAGGDERDTLVGGDGNDSVVGGAGNDSLTGDNGDDLLDGQAGNDTLTGGWGDDNLFGASGNDSLRGGWGNDGLSGGANNDKLYGDDGDDSLAGHSGPDSLWGGAGNDVLYGGGGADKLYGEAGNDGLFAGSGDGAESLAGGAGADRLLLAGGDVATGLAAEDARIVFSNSPALSGKKFTGQGDTLFSFAAGAWENADIERVDASFAVLHRHVGSTRLLKKADGTEMSFLAVGEQTDSNAFRVGGWNGGGQIAVVTPENDSDMGMARLVYHEFGHNWDQASENPFTAAFRAVSGWVEDPDSTAGYTASIGIGDDWYYLTSKAGTFARNYGKTNPLEDMATTWEAYFVNKYHGGAAALAAQGLTRNDAKWDTLDDLFVIL